MNPSTAAPTRKKPSSPDLPQSALGLARAKTGPRLSPHHQAAGVSSRRRFSKKEGLCSYHVMSRTAGGEHLLGKIEKEAFRIIMRKMSRFTGVRILTYAIMDNHFHLLVHVPDRKKWLTPLLDSAGHPHEEKTLKHLSTLYSSAYLSQLHNEISTLRSAGREKEIRRILQKYLDRLCDLTIFVKELKERFSRWYNHFHDRRGTLWMDRFKSVAVEDGRALRTMAAYIDLNPVRAGLVKDPKDYHWSGYGEAMAGKKVAQQALCGVLEVGRNSWKSRGRQIYRCWLYIDGVSHENPQKTGFSLEKMRKVKKQQGMLGRPEILLTRLRHFGTSLAVGSEDFVNSLTSRYQNIFARTKRRKKHPVQGTDFYYA